MIYVAGGTSFLGKKVVEKLLEENKEVRCLFRNEEAKNKLQDLVKKYPDKLSLVSGNLLSADSLIYGLKGTDAAVYLVRLEYVEFVQNFLDAVRRAGIKRVVFISSTTALSPKDEDIKKKKLEAEELIKRSNLDYTILRPSMIYGGAGDNNFHKMLSFIKRKGFFVEFGDGKNLIQPIYVGDVCKAIINVLDNPVTFKKTYEICGKEAIKYEEMLEIVKRKLNKNFKIIKLPIGLSKFLVNIYNKLNKKSDLKPEQIEGMKIDKAYSYSEAQKDFGFSPLSFEEGIELEIKEISS